LSHLFIACLYLDRTVSPLLALWLRYFATVQCRSPLVEGADRCFTVRGAFTLVTVSGSNRTSDDVVKPALETTKSAMNQGDRPLNRIYPGVRDVSFLNAVDPDAFLWEQEVNKNWPGASSNRFKEEKGLPPWSWILIWIAIIVTILLTCWMSRQWRCWRRRQENTSTASTLAGRQGKAGKQKDGDASGLGSPATSLERWSNISTSSPLSNKSRPPSSVAAMATEIAALAQSKHDDAVVEATSPYPIWQRGNDSGDDHSSSSDEPFQDSDSSDEAGAFPTV
jgi:hypothetical protein